MHGAVTEVEVWGGVLTLPQLEDWRDCATNTSGDVLHWATAVLDTQGLEVIEVDRREVCSSREEKVEIQSFGITKSFQNSTQFCKNLGGEIAVAKDEETFKSMLGKSN